MCGRACACGGGEGTVTQVAITTTGSSSGNQANEGQQPTLRFHVALQDIVILIAAIHSLGRQHRHAVHHSKPSPPHTHGHRPATTSPARRLRCAVDDDSCVMTNHPSSRRSRYSTSTSLVRGMTTSSYTRATSSGATLYRGCTAAAAAAPAPPAAAQQPPARDAARARGPVGREHGAEQGQRAGVRDENE